MADLLLHPAPLLDLLGILHKFEVRNGTLQNLNIGINFLRNRFQNNNIGKQCGKLSIQFHLVVPDDIQQTYQQRYAFDIEYAFCVQHTE